MSSIGRVFTCVLSGLVLILGACGPAAPQAAPTTAPAAAAPTSAPLAAAPTQTPAAIAKPTAAAAAAPASTQASTSAQRQPKSGGSIVIALRADPFQLDPIKDLGSDGNDVMQTSQAVESLIDVGPDGQPTPALAEAMPDVTDNGLTYTFKLRKGVKFQDGTEFNADAVKFNWMNLIDPTYGTRQASRLAPLVKSIDVVDPYTIRISFTQVFPDFMAELVYRTWWRINSPAAVKAQGKDYGVKSVVGTGPFKLKELVQGDRIVFEKNPDYWQKGFPYLDQITYKPITDPSVKILNLQTGTVDVVLNLPLASIPDVKKDPNSQVLTHGSGINELIFLNTGQPELKDKRVRQALSLAIDRKSINELLFNGLGEVPNGPFPSWHWAYAKDVPPLEYNPEKAKQLLSDAGYGGNNALEFELRTWTDPKLVDQSTLVKSMWEKIGVRVTITQLDKAAFYDPILGTKVPEKYSKFWAGLSDFSGGFPDQASYVQYEYQGGGALNTSLYNEPGGFQNPDVEKLIVDVMSTSDQAKAAQLYAQITKQLQEDMPQISLMWLPNVVAIRNRVQDYRIDSQNFNPLKTVWVDK